MKLKPCPFCGGKGKVYPCYFMTNEILYWINRCQKCECTLGQYDTEIKARNAWNRRVK